MNRTIPTRRLVLLAALPLAWSIFSTVFEGALAPLFAANAILFVAGAIDYVWSRPRLLKLSRQVPRVWSVGRNNLVAIDVTSMSRRQLTVRINNDLPKGTTSSDLPLRVTIPANGQARVWYRARPSTRGAYELGNQYVRFVSPLGLWTRQLGFAAQDEIRIYPDVRAVRTYDMLARQNREALMARATQLRGGESEFSRLRDYEKDDAYRSIDWKATARRQRLTSREYQKERDQDVICVLDCGRLMTAEAEGMSLADHALNATLMLGHVANRSGDRVGLVTYDDAVTRFVAPTGGPGASARLIRAAYDVHPRLVESNHAGALETLATRVRKRSLIILFTQIVDDEAARNLRKLMRSLPRRHLALCVLFKDDEIQDAADAPLSRDLSLDDPELYRRAAASEVVMWKEGVVRELTADGAQVVQTFPHAATGTLVNQYLEIKARHLL